MPDPDWDSLKAELEPIVDQYIAAHPEVLSAFQTGGAETLAATASATAASGEEDAEDFAMTDEDFEELEAAVAALNEVVADLEAELKNEGPEEFSNEINQLAGATIAEPSGAAGGSEN